MTTFLWIIIYLVAGTGANLVADRLNKNYIDDLFSRYEKTDFEGADRYFKRKLVKVPEKMNWFMIVMICLLGAICSSLWPITTTVSVIWNHVAYIKTLKEGKETVGV